MPKGERLSEKQIIRMSVEMVKYVDSFVVNSL